MKDLISKRLVNIAVGVIASLIVLVIIINYYNNQIIEENRLLQKQTEEVKVTFSRFAIIIIHNLDLGLRGYALFNHEKYLAPLNFALRDKDSLFQVAEKALVSHGYPMEEFYQLKDSIDAYAAFCLKLKNLYDNGELEEFQRLGNLDKGYELWLQYEKLAEKIYAFEDRINREATERYYRALKTNYYVLILLLVISLPTLWFTATHTRKKFALTEKLRDSEAEKAFLLAKQNETLERMVEKRTREIQNRNKEMHLQQEEIEAQNEELLQQQEQIALQRDMLSDQNEKLYEAQLIIQKQNEEIKIKNEFLEEEVRERTKELLEYNQQLEQFAYMAAHNLRAPVARILGLGKVLTLNPANTVEDVQMISKKLVSATVELDQVIKDLNMILEIKSSDSQLFTRVNFSEELKLVRSNLENEIFDTKAQILESFEEAPDVVAVKAYIDSIIFNLISNAIKYRHPERRPVIQVHTFQTDEFICLSVSDNRLGIEQESLKDLFNFYTRFHFHVEGKGLGLYLVKTQVVSLGGKIEVESTINLGTTFRIYFKKMELEENEKS